MTTQHTHDLLTVRANTGAGSREDFLRAGRRLRSTLRDIASADRLLGEVEASRSLSRLY